MKQYTFISILLLISSTAFAQNTNNRYDLEIESRYVTNNKSDAAFKATRIKQHLLAIPVKNKFLNIGLDYSYVNIEFREENSINHDLRDFHKIGFSLSYQSQINDSWTMTTQLTPRINSNLTDGIKSEDLNINALLLFNHSKSRNSLLSLGVIYSNKLGHPAPFPIINYWKQFNSKWRMNLGLPRMSLSHCISNKSTITGFAEYQGFSSNIGNDINNQSFRQNRTAEKISYKDIITGLEYIYKTKQCKFSLSGGYTLNRTFELRNNNKDTAYKFDMSNNFYIGFNASFKLKQK
ncbi:hypothetical protein EYV94_14460 [Puteibacter caeruleilacunae]|nr:hypothetical protein EYV94_14460 [Puteibacter caeruleilacunae]